MRRIGIIWIAIRIASSGGTSEDEDIDLQWARTVSKRKGNGKETKNSNTMTLSSKWALEDTEEKQDVVKNTTSGRV